MNKKKDYVQPNFELVRTDESNKVFFAASGTPGGPALGGSINSMTSTDGNW